MLNNRIITDDALLLHCHRECVFQVECKMSLVICDYLINMAYVILAMVYWLQKLCLLVVIVMVHSEQEGSNRSLVSS